MDREATKRRHVREKSVIDHLARKLYQPKKEEEKPDVQQDSQTSTGLPVEDQVRKEWDSGKGGLPVFLR
jgi:hypothetical protein